MSVNPRFGELLAYFVRAIGSRVGHFFCLVWFAVASVPVAAQLSVPALTSRVIDLSATLSEPQRQALDGKLAAFEASKGTQVVVLLLPTTLPEDIASYANRVANEWKIGRKDIGDGLLLVAAMQDHKIRLEVGKTLEGAIPDLEAKRIIDGLIAPSFRQSDFNGGLDKGLDRVLALVSGESLPAPRAPQPHSQGGFDWMQLGIFMFIAVPVVGVVTKRILGNQLGAIATGGVAGVIVQVVTSSLVLSVLAGMLAMLFTLVQRTSVGRAAGPGLRRNHSGWGIGGGFGNEGGGAGFGGGFSSGGGGDFGGGGASGDW